MLLLQNIEKLYKKYSEFVESGEDPSKINDIVNANANEAIANMEIVNNDMKAIRKELSQFVIGASGKVSNYANKGRTPVFQNVATEFLNANLKAQKPLASVIGARSPRIGARNRVRDARTFWQISYLPL